MLKADLHIHTTASDGSLTPTQIVSHALQTDLDVIAITDHDTISGVAEAKIAAEKSSLRVLQGAEVSTIFEDRECHILAYGFEDASIMQQLLGGQKYRRIERAHAIISKLKKLGFDITYDEVVGEAGRASIGRPHIARVMIRKGYAATMQEVFLRYLGNDSSAYHHIDYPDAGEAINLVHQAGGYAVLAHPGDSYNFIELKMLMDMGLDGVECYHSSHNSAHNRKYLEYCHSHGLIATGGSDFHGSVKDFYHLGVIYIDLEPESPLFESSRVPENKSISTY